MKNVGDAMTRQVKQTGIAPPKIKGSPYSTLETFFLFTLVVSDMRGIARTPYLHTTLRMWCCLRAPLDCGCSTSMESSVRVVERCPSCGMNCMRCIQYECFCVQTT